MPNRLFDTHFVCEIVTAYLVSYLISENYEDEESIDIGQVTQFVVDNFSYITEEVIKKTNIHDYRELEDGEPEQNN